MKFSKIIISTLIAACAYGAIFAADDRYWKGTTAEFRTASFWATDFEGTTDWTTDLGPTDGANIYLSNYGTADGQVNSLIDFNTNAILGNITNERTNTAKLKFQTGTSTGWVLYTSAGARNWTVGTITQNSSAFSLDLRRGATAGISLSVTADAINVLNGTLNMGQTSSDQRLISLTIKKDALKEGSGNVDVASTGALRLNTDVNGTLDIQGKLESAGSTAIRLSDGATATVGSIKITGGDKLFNISKQDDSTGVGTTTSFTVGKFEATSTVTSLRNMFNVGTFEHKSKDALSLDSFTASDFFYNVNDEAHWVVKSFNVKKIESDPSSTGTFDYNSSKRFRFITNSMDVDNFKTGTAIIEIGRGMDKTDTAATGVMKFETINSASTNFRLGYYYNSTYYYTLYKTVSIGSLTLGAEANILGETITVDTLSKKATVTGKSVEFGNTGVDTAVRHANSITIGKNATSNHLIESGFVTLYAQTNAIKGTLNLTPSGTDNVTFAVSAYKTITENRALSRTLTVDNIVLSSMSNKGNAVFNAYVNDSYDSGKFNLNSIDVTSIKFVGSGTNLMRFGANAAAEGQDPSVKIGTITASTVLDAESNPLERSVGSIYAYSDIKVGTINVESGYKDGTTKSNQVTFTAYNAPKFEATNVNVGGASTLGIGTDDRRFSAIKIDNLNYDSTNALDRSVTLYTTKEEGKNTINIKNLTATGNSVVRLNTYADTHIETLNYTASETGVFKAYKSKLTIDTFTKSGTATIKMGDDTLEDERLSYLNVGTLTLNRGVMTVYSTVDGTVDITTLNTSNQTGGAMMNFTGTTTIGDINLQGAHATARTGISLRSATKIMTVTGGIDVSSTAGVLSVNNLNVTGVINANATNSASRLVLNESMTTGSNVVISTAGLTSTGSNAATLTTIGTSGNQGTDNVSLNFKGTSTYNYAGTIVDTDGSFSITQSVVSITKEGAGKQYLRGDVSVRGLVEVKAGDLYVNASTGTGLSGGVAVSGGKFGAVSASEVGVIKTSALTWSNLGVIAVDVTSVGNDMINISGDFTKSLSDSAGLYTFEFTLGEGFDSDIEYEIIHADGTFGFTKSDFDADVVGGLYKASFDIRNGSVFASFTLIPEASHYAAIFAVFALITVALRRRKNK